MIIIGYQGIGKSTLAGKYNCVDLESKNFWVNGKRSDDWYIPYCQIANHLSEQGFTVFVSSHEVVRKELFKSREKVMVICPSLDLQTPWIKKLEDRYSQTRLEKDYKALKNAEDRYFDNIMDLLIDRFEVVRIDSMDYSLENIVKIISSGYEKFADDNMWKFVGAHIL